MKRWLYALLVLMASPTWAENYLDGMWSGAYDYGDQFGPNPVWFSVVFETKDDEIRGRSLEVQTFGREPSVGLSATFKGLQAGNMITLIKQYDGSGGQTHSVQLNLSYDDNGNLVGDWILDTNTRGRVELFKLTLENAASAPDDEGWE